MSYGILLKNATNNFIVDDLPFYACQRASISTSDPFYFALTGFNSSNSIALNYSQTGNLIGSTASNFSNVNFDLNENQFYGLCLNVSRPTVVELCQIEAFEVGVGQTVYTDSFTNDAKYIMNLSDPGNVYTKTSSYPLGVQTSDFGLGLNYLWPSASYNLQNFTYVRYSDTNFTKYFLAVPQTQGAVIPNDFKWYELPSTKFFYSIDYSVTLSFVFNGSSIPLANFNGIIPKIGEKILVNNSLNNDDLSGVYDVISITNYVNLAKSDISYNYPGQIFIVRVDIDFSDNLNYNPNTYYVPFEYGYPAICFTKPLMLRLYENIAQNDPSKYIPLYRDNFSFSSLILHLNNQTKFNKQSDTFILGIAVSNWYPDSKLFGVGLNYVIKEGYEAY
jgi:hypothetical protein